MSSSRAFEVTTPAVCRPEVFRNSLESFLSHVERPPEMRWYINVDPVGNGSLEEMQRVPDEFDLACEWNIPEVGSLNAAIRWLWSQVQGDVFLHLEDDVEFIADASLIDMLEEFQKHPRLAYLGFRRPGFPQDDSGLQFDYRGEAICWRSGRYRLSFQPGLFSGEFARRSAELIEKYPDPEVQFHMANKDLMAWAEEWRYATYGTPSDEHVLHDIGRRHRNQGWKKIITDRGTTWERSEQT